MSENTHNASFVRALEFVPKKAITRLVLVETLGSIAPPTKQSLHVFAKAQRKRWAPTATNTDRTV